MAEPRGTNADVQELLVDNGGNMKRLLSALSLLMVGGTAYAVSNQSVSISSGNAFYQVDVSSMTNGFVRQNIVIGDPNNFNAVAPVSTVTGLTVNLATGTSVVGEVVIQQPTVIGATVTYNGTQSVNVGTLYQPSVIGATVTFNGTQNTQLMQTTVVGATVTYNGVQTVTVGNYLTTGTVTALYQPTVIGATVTYNGTQQVNVGTLYQPTVIGATVTFNGAQSVYGSTITIMTLNNNTTAIPISGSINANSVNITTAAWDTAIPGQGSIVGGLGPTGLFQSFRMTVSSDVSVNVVQTSFTVVGNVASGATDSGNSVKIGGIGRTTYQAVVTDGQRADAQLDSEGKQVIIPYAVPALSTSGVTAAMTGTASTVILSSGATGVNTYVTHLSCFNSHATVGTVINIKNGNVLKYTGYATAAGGGWSSSFPTPINPNGTASEWTATNATTGSNTYCDMTGFLTKN